MYNGDANPFATNVGHPSPAPNDLEQNQQVLEHLANVCKNETVQQDIHLAERLIEVGGIYGKIKTADRNFKIFMDIPEFTHANLDAAIALSKIKDINKICCFGWKKLYSLYINSAGITYSKISLDNIKKDFGDLSPESVEKAFLQIVLKSNKLGVQKMNDYWNKGLRLEMLRDKRNIKKICETKNISQTINGIINKYVVKAKPKLQDYFENYHKLMQQIVKLKDMMRKTGKYDYCIDLQTLINDLAYTSELIERILPTNFEEKKLCSEFIDKILGEV